MSLEKIAINATKWIGSIQSLITHTILFSIACLLCFFFNIDKILLIVTTIVSLEAIYLSIFIQISVNSSKNYMKKIKEGVESIQDDIEDLQE
jgi:hypothetical protein